MMLETVFLALTFAEGVWYLLSFVVFLTTLGLIGLILLQDSKDTGLTSAFGGGGNTSLMGARMQKDLAKMTGVLAAVLAISLFTMGIISAKTSPSAAAVDAVPPPVNQPEPTPTPLGGNPLDGMFPGNGLTPPTGGPLTPGGINPTPTLPTGLTPVPGATPTPTPIPLPTPLGTPPAPVPAPAVPASGSTSATPPAAVPPAAIPPAGVPPTPTGSPTPTPPAPPAPEK